MYVATHAGVYAFVSMHMNSLQSTIDKKHWYTYISYYWYMALSKICQQHCTYLSPSTTTVVYIKTIHISLKNKLPLLFIMLMPYICQQKVFLSNPKFMQHIKISSYAETRPLCQCKYFIWSQYYQQYDQKHSSCLLCSTYRSIITGNIS